MTRRNESFPRMTTRRCRIIFAAAVVVSLLCSCQPKSPAALLSMALATNVPSNVKVLQYWEVSSKDPTHYWKLSHNRRGPQSLAGVRLQPYGGKEKVDYLLQIAQFHLGTNFVPAEVEKVYVGDGPTDHSQMFVISTESSVVSYVILDYF
jgi:hypothetical protein